MSKLYDASDLIKLFTKLEGKFEDLKCFVKDCCAKIPVNIGTGIGIFKRFNANKWEFKSLLPGNNILITETAKEIVISSTTEPIDCNDIKDCIGITPSGDANKYLNEQGDFLTITVPPSFIQSISDTSNIDLTVTGTDLSADLTDTTVTPSTYGDASNIPQITVDQKGRITSIVDIPITIPPNFIDSVSDTSSIDLTVTGTTLSADFINNAGYTTLSSFSSGTGISYDNLTGVITNSAPDQTVVLTPGTNIGISGAYPSFTINGLNSERRNDWVAPYSYCGSAPNGSAESASVWTIYRIQVAGDGTVTTLSATNVAWTDRLIVIYT